MEKHVVLLGVCLVVGLLLLVPFVKEWWKARKEQKDMGRLKFGESNNSAPFPSMVVVFKTN